MEMLDITPHVNLLRSLRGERIDYVVLVGEGVDNALDAGATVIAVTVDQDEIGFQDNGAGITGERIISLFSLGDHGAMPTTQLGRFGIGIKSQAVNAGDIFVVTSTSCEGRVKVRANWREILKGGGRRWEIPAPKWTPALVGAKTGTTIQISELRKPRTVPFDKIIDDIAQRFYPALACGCKLTMNGATVSAIADPKLTDVIDHQLSLSGGRSAHLHAGLLVGPSKLNRVHVAYKHRVIMPASQVGCDGYGGITKMFARLQLSGPWHLAKFKNDLTDEEERDELEDAVGAALKPILDKCNNFSLSARIHELSALINELVPHEIAVRPKQKKGSTSSGKKNGQASGDVAPDKSDQAKGPAKTMRPPPKLLITFDGNNEEDGVGSYSPGRVQRVNLARDNPFIARLVQHRDQNVAAEALYAVALCIYDTGRQGHQPELPLDGNFGQRVAKLLLAQAPELSALSST